MKRFLPIVTFTLLFTTQALATYESIGVTKDCPFRASVLRVTSPTQEKQLHLIQASETYQLEFEGKLGGAEYYASSIQEPFPLGELTFDALIMAPEMSRLSELRVYYSGVMHRCLIEK